MKNESVIAHEKMGLPLGEDTVLVVWGHGWGQSRAAFAPLAESLARQASHLLIDFPGFGASVMPDSVWDTAAYADSLVPLLTGLRPKVGKILWVGHSFGGRVGIQLAARHPGLVDGLFLLSTAGLQRRRSLYRRAVIKARILLFKTCKIFAPLFGISLDTLRAKFGSADYRAAGAMRPIFLNVIREDLSAEARKITCPTLLVYGTDDTETPPEMGQRLATLIPGATLSFLPHQDHYTVLGAGRALVQKRLVDFMEGLRK